MPKRRAPCRSALSGCLLAVVPRTGGGPRRRRRADSERNCVSNVRPPHGLSYAQAADTVAGLLTAARELGASGVVLKDEGPALPAGAG